MEGGGVGMSRFLVTRGDRIFPLERGKFSKRGKYLRKRGVERNFYLKKKTHAHFHVSTIFMFSIILNWRLNTYLIVI